MWVSCRDWGEIEIQSEIEFEGWHHHLLASRFEPPAGWSQIVSLKPWVSSLKSQARSLKCKAQGSSSSLKAPSQSPSRAELQPGSAHQPSQRPGLSFSVRPQSSPEALFFRISKFRKWEGASGYGKTFENFYTFKIIFQNFWFLEDIFLCLWMKSLQRKLSFNVINHNYNMILKENQQILRCKACFVRTKMWFFGGWFSDFWKFWNFICFFI